MCGPWLLLQGLRDVQQQLAACAGRRTRPFETPRRELSRYCMRGLAVEPCSAARNSCTRRACSARWILLPLEQRPCVGAHLLLLVVRSAAADAFGCYDSWSAKRKSSVSSMVASARHRLRQPSSGVAYALCLVDRALQPLFPLTRWFIRVDLPLLWGPMMATTW